MRAVPAKQNLTICFAHVAYRMAERFALRGTGIGHFQVGTLAELDARLSEFDVLCVSMMWRNEFVARAPRLAFIQSISAGTDQYDRDALAAAGIRLASAQGVNAEAVAQHAMALILALQRQLHLARDNQARRHWRGMISDLSQREDELAGKTLLIVGLGRIGSRLSALARAFGMRTLATKRNASAGADAADAVFPQERLHELLPQADVVALTCPLTPQTQGLIGAAALAAMKPSAMLVNVARGRVVDEAALVEALAGRRIAAAGIDCTVEEPLPAASPLWALDNALITPHTAGETRRYEDNVIDLLLENLERIWRGEPRLRNHVV
ncbi:MAG TPA: D-2-hydroxyacid dehydrogenase [Xanthobacteraceae bacterium]|nr:D-2-hydroxyacid dehydrogenase [Xanthobacteraceae bacterium]